MKNAFYLLGKYWRKHKKNLAAVLFSGVLLAAMVFVLLILRREYSVRKLEDMRFVHGAYDVMIMNSNDEILAEVTEGKTGWTYGYVDVVGELGEGDERFLVGVAHDELDLFRLYLSEGRLPETADELLLDDKLVSSLHWVGKCGENITLDGKTYTVTGIIDTSRTQRWGWQSAGYYETEHFIPSAYVGAGDDFDNPPLYRIDMLGNYYYTELLPGMDERYAESAKDNAYSEYFRERYEKPGDYETIFLCTWDLNDDFSWLTEYGDSTSFILFIAYIGIAVAVLSVFSVMKSVFAERAAWISTLKRIGANRFVIAKLYAAECAFLALIQTIAGIAAGCAAYGIMFAYKVKILGEVPLSGFTTNFIITNNTREPFLYAAIFSLAVLVPAYLLCVLTSKIKAKKLRKVKKPRSLWKCFGRVFANGSVTVVQTASLTLIIFSVVMSYLYFTRTGKEEMTLWLTMPFEIDDYYAGGVDMKEEGIVEYYFCNPPVLTGLGHMDRDTSQYLLTINPDDTMGFGDDTAEKLPAGTISVGNMEYLFTALDEPNGIYGDEIDLSEVHDLFFETSADKFRNFFDEGQLGSKHLYQVPTRLADSASIESLEEYLKDGEINLDKINGGEEVLVAYKSRPPFEVGDKITLYVAEANVDGYGVGNITSTEVTVGGTLQILGSAPVLDSMIAREDGRSWNLLTTATGAVNFGAPSVAYSKAFAFEEVKGAPFPLSAELSVTSLKKLKREIFVNKMKKLGSIALILVAMSLLGFSAYFNGIGMKIRAKKYEASVIRAVGAPVKAIRKRLMLSSLKIPLAASAIAYGLVRIFQAITGKLGAWFMEQKEILQEMESAAFNSIFMKDVTELEKQEVFKESDALDAKLNAVRRLFFLNNGMWNPKAEIPTLIIFVIICAATFILTALALKKFKRNIAFDLNNGRTKQ